MKKVIAAFIMAFFLMGGVCSAGQIPTGVLGIKWDEDADISRAIMRDRTSTYKLGESTEKYKDLSLTVATYITTFSGYKALVWLNFWDNKFYKATITIPCREDSIQNVLIVLNKSIYDKYGDFSQLSNGQLWSFSYNDNPVSISTFVGTNPIYGFKPINSFSAPLTTLPASANVVYKNDTLDLVESALKSSKKKDDI